MNDPNRLIKWLAVIGLAVLSLTILYPPSEKLKGGIDLVGGTSLLFEIDTTGLDQASQRDLSTRVMDILKERVDPKGQLNLEWRPVGSTRLEIRMPRPPEEARRRREVYNRALDRIKGLNIARFDVELALHADDRQAALEGLVRGVTERAPLIAALESAYDEYLAAQDTDDAADTEAVSDAYEEAMSELLATSMPVVRLTDVLALDAEAERSEQLRKLREKFPSYDSGPVTSRLITMARRAYDDWAENKADLEDPSDLKRRLRGAGVLEFRILADRDPNSPTHTGDPNPLLRQEIGKYTDQLSQYGPRPRPGDRFRWFPVDNLLRFLHVDDISQFEDQKELPGWPIVEEYAGRYYALFHSDPEYSMLHSTTRGKQWKLTAAFPDRNPLTGENVVTFALDPRGGRQFGELTGNNVGRQLCIMLDGHAVSHATINERITNRCQISGRFTFQRVQDLVRTLDAGSLPARLKETPLQEKTIGPSLGETNRRLGVQAAVWGAVVVAVFVLFYYGIAAGGMANLALALNLLFVLAIMALMQATFTLPGIAGLILTVGMAIDANVLIFERIREERDRGVVFKKALNAGYDKAFSTITDANLTTLITCVILGFVGSEEVKGFAIVLGIGISTSMFTALFVTRLIFNTLIFKGWLKDLSMRRVIGKPSVDWISLRRGFWPASVVAVVIGVALFVGLSVSNKEAVFDIEFLGGTSVQIDLKPGVTLTDEQIDQAITATDGAAGLSATQWLRQAADQLEAAEVTLGEQAGEFVMASATLTGDDLAVLMHGTIEDQIERRGFHPEAHRVTFDALPGAFELSTFEEAVTHAAEAARAAAARVRNARVQSVGELKPTENAGLSYEIVTVETNRPLVQEAILAALGKDLLIQQKVSFVPRQDDELTKEHYFVVEAEDQYLSDVVGGDANFDVRRFRGGVAVAVDLAEDEEPFLLADLEKRLREVALQTEFEQYRTRNTAVYQLEAGAPTSDGAIGYRKFAVLAVDETLMHGDDELRWAEDLAEPTLAQVKAALESEKSLSKVVQFAPQIAGQTQNRAIFAIILALAAIVSYLWLRFGTKEYGLAAIVALVHDVAITLGLVVLSHFIYDSVFGRVLRLSDFKIDLPMIAAVLTVIGYSLNDTIVVFDRIRENRGKLGSLSPNLINISINQTLSRTLLTSITTFLVVIILYIWGGKGIHSFSFALLIGVVVGTYSSIGIATPLLYRPQLLRNVVTVIVGLALIGLVLAQIDHTMAKWTFTVLIALACVGLLIRSGAAGAFSGAGRPAPA